METNLSRAAAAAIRVAALAFVALGLAGLGGCASSHRCESQEVCDGRDNDCDQQTDESFVNGDGVYDTVEHCGGCGIECAAVFPGSSETACVALGDTARCELIACAEGFHAAGAGACLVDQPVLCLPCTADADCAAGGPSARCSAGSCLPACDAAGACAAGSVCELTETGETLCVPAGGDCVCSDANEGLEVGCVLLSPVGDECAGKRTCSAGEFSECESALEELCNQRDDDCDGEADEDFRNDEGVYVSPAHCGACGEPCVAPGPNMVALCEPAADTALCEVACVDGFVDVDGIAPNGCECELWDGVGPPPVIGGDSDCDGILDNFTDFVYVTPTGSDANAGTSASPLRSLAAAIAKGSALGRDVVVAGGVYDGAVNLAAGVGVFGGYRSDFRERDLALYPVTLQRTGGVPGEPVVRCVNIVLPTVFDGFTVIASAAARAADGSTAVYADGCTAAVRFENLLVHAAPGADGARGEDSSDKVADWGLTDLGDLVGVDGGKGKNAPNMDVCPPLAGGTAGVRVCPLSGAVSGGTGGGAECPVGICSDGAACANGGCTDFTEAGVCDYETVLDLAVPNPPASPGSGVGGGAAGVSTYNSPTNRGVCNFCDDNLSLPRFGDGGADGAPGLDGGGGAGCAGGPAFDATSGRLSGRAGGDGTSGTDGAGGGGGSAGAGYLVTTGTFGCADRSGGSGGGGGSGGCGAPGAGGGTGGGASIGIAVRAVAGEGPTMGNVRVITARGGRGGDGGVGANGGSAGVGGEGGRSQFWCSRAGGHGGNGGAGGAAGGGGGGCGGASHGVYVLGGDGGYAARIAAGAAVDAVGAAGKGGRGGFSPAAVGTDGADGRGEAIRVDP